MFNGFGTLKTIGFPIAFLKLFQFFQNCSPNRFLRVPVPNFYKQLDLGAISDFHGFQKGILWWTFSHEVSTFAMTCSWFGRPCRDPVFHKTMVITVPFGPSAFKKVICLMKIGTFSVFVHNFLCAMFYIFLLSLCHKHR